MLELVGISHQIARKKQEPLVILNQVSFTAPAGHLMAILGPTLSGKTTLMNILAGQVKPWHGAMVWHGKDIARNPIHPNEVGFVPQADDVLHDALTVQENIVSAVLLRVAGLPKQEAVGRAAHLMVVAGLEMISGQRAATLSVAQRRRLKLAVALVSDPTMVLCDEFTDGLDAKSERELTALLQMVAGDNPRRLVINATQNLSNLAAYNTVVLLNEGNVCFHGPARALPHYFSVKQLEEIYSRMAKRPAHRWGESWDKHRDTYYNAFKMGGDTDALAPASEDDEKTSPGRTRESEDSGVDAADAGLPPGSGDRAPAAAALPAFGSQLQHLLKRRWTVFRRTPADWLAHASMLVGFPLLAVLMMWRSKGRFIPGGEAAQVAYATSMAVFLQVLLIIAMAARNGAREVAGERALFLREKLGGLRSSAYVLGKLLYLAPLCIAQGACMALLADVLTGGLPGNGGVRLGLLVAAAIAFTLVCLGISACSRSRHGAGVAALLLLLAQVPLSGALLPLPAVLETVVHPLVTAHAAWSGCLDTLNPSDVITAFDKLNGTWLVSPSKAFAILAVHAIVGLAMLVAGVGRQKV